MSFALYSATPANKSINIQVIERLVCLHAQVAMNAAEAAPDDRFLGLALLNPAPVLLPHRMIRPYWLVYNICRFSGWMDSVPFLRQVWRALLKKVLSRCAPQPLTFAT
jgi:hypothetical protein